MLFDTVGKLLENYGLIKPYIAYIHVKVALSYWFGKSVTDVQKNINN